MIKTGWAFDKSVIDDVLEFSNDTKTQRDAWKGDVNNYIKQKEVINQQYADAYEYEM